MIVTKCGVGHQHRTSSPDLVAVGHVIFDNALRVNDVALFRNGDTGHYTLNFPINSSKTGVGSQPVHPLNEATRRMVLESMINAYRKLPPLDIDFDLTAQAVTVGGGC